MKDYSKFEGLKITHIDRYGNEVEGIVTGCDYNIGITIQEVKRNRYLFCMSSKRAFKIRGGNIKNWKQYMYRREFLNAIGQFKNGKFSEEVFLSIAEPTTVGENASLKTCPFSQ